MNQEEKKWFEKLHKEQEISAKEFMKPRHRGFWTSVIEKYSDPAHFIYELLQNADDANATSVHIRLEHDGLLFKHNGTTHFTVSSYDTEEEDRKAKRLGHVNSITAVGFSTKDDRGKDNTIGKFGVGFKAVFQYTNTPEIYDDNICFRIVNYIVPEGVHKVKKLYFVTPKRCTMQEYSEIPLANNGDEVVVEYYNEGKICNVKTGCLKCINPIVLNQKKQFDYKAKYNCVIVGRTGFFDYEMKIVGNSDEPKRQNVRLNKAAKEFNVGIPTMVKFLQSRGYVIPCNPNARLTIEQYRLIEAAFGNK